MLTRSVMKHGDYMAVISFDPSADAFHGRVVGITDVVNFYGRSPKELRREFKTSIDEYVAWCAEEGQSPQKTWAGKTTFRADDELHRRLEIVAAIHDQSVNAYMTKILDRETRKELEDLD